MAFDRLNSSIILILFVLLYRKANSRFDPLYVHDCPVQKGLPKNPFNDLTTVICDIVTTDISAAVSGGTAGWKFYTQTGRLIADDGAHDAN